MEPIISFCILYPGLKSLNLHLIQKLSLPCSNIVSAICMFSFFGVQHTKVIQWPNLKNLNGGLNLSRGLNMVGST